MFGQNRDQTLIHLMTEEKFDRVIYFLDRIEDSYDREDLLRLSLTMYAINRLGNPDLYFTTDKDECDRYMALVGQNSRKIMLYHNPETDMIEGGIDELIDAVIPKGHPLMVYLDMLVSQRKDSQALKTATD